MCVPALAIISKGKYSLAKADRRERKRNIAECPDKFWMSSDSLSLRKEQFCSPPPTAVSGGGADRLGQRCQRWRVGDSVVCDSGGGQKPEHRRKAVGKQQAPD